MQEQKSEIVTIEHYADVATSIISDVLNRYVVSIPENKFDVDIWEHTQSLEWVRARINDAFNSQMLWAGADPTSDELLIKMMSERIEYLSTCHQFQFQDIPLQQQEFKDNLFVALDMVEVMILELVAHYVSANPWWIWSLRFSSDFVLIESVEDYRLKIFNEKVESGEWVLS